VVTSHGRALCATDDGVAVIDGDIRDPRSILADPELTAVIDFTEPVAILCVAVLHFIREEEDPGEIVTTLRGRMVPGSYLAISHAAIDGADKQVLSEISRAYQDTTASAVPRTAAQIRELFTGLDLVHPGLVDVSQWRPHVRARPTKIRILAGVGHKP